MHYRANLRDIEFNLFEANAVQNYLGAAPYEDFDHDIAMDMLREVERLATEDVAASFVEGDRADIRLVDGAVELPAGIKQSLDAIYDGGWHLFGVPKELGGFGAPSALRWAATEMLVGANPAAFLYVSSGLTAVVLSEVGTPEQIERFVVPMLENKWGGTMVLTEPAAGSDVGAGTTKAIHVEGDVYHLEGVKRFITSAEHDYSDNIIHLVLARREGGEPGTPGLSMFIVPKFLVNEDGTLGERNGVVTTNIEKKMGIKASTTCELTFGVDTPCVGYLVGGVHEGIRQMFKVIEDARMLIGTKSMATLSTGYLNALEYAKERIQSADLTQARDKTAPRVPIIRHPNVRRMLMDQKSHSEGMRALVMYTAWTLDQMRLHPEDEYWQKLNALLLPLVKGYSSEKAYALLADSLQIFGGSGYTQDYPIEQYIRDAKIDTVYEGTTGIQALDLFFRKIARDQGQTLMRFAEHMLEVVKGGPDDLAVERQLLGTAMEDLQAHLAVMVGHSMASAENPKEIYLTGLHANALLDSLAEVVIGWLLLKHAEIALDAMGDAGDADRSFYAGKVASARYFARTVLPKTRLRREAAEAEDGAIMEIPVEAF